MAFGDGIWTSRSPGLQHVSTCRSTCGQPADLEEEDLSRGGSITVSSYDS